MNTKTKLQPKWILCGLLVLLALICIFPLQGYDFSGYFFLGLAALIPTYHIIRHQKVLTIMLTVLLILFFLALAVTGYTIVSHSAGTQAPTSEYLVVLGAGVNGTVPSRSLRERLDAAYDYLIDHPGAVAIVSGGQGTGEQISEAECMYQYLTSAGIEENRVLMEDQATNTIENLQYALNVIENRAGRRITRVAIVSSEYHLYRAELFAKQLGLEAEMVPAKTEMIPLRWNYYLREIFAVWYYSIFGG